MELDITPVEEHVKIGGKEYVLREASGDAAARYKNAILSSGTMGPNGNLVEARSVADADAILVSLCLWEQHGKNERQVPVNVVRSWPHRTVDALYERALDISGLRGKRSKEEEEAEAKNSPSATEDGSS